MSRYFRQFLMALTGGTAIAGWLLSGCGYVGQIPLPPDRPSESVVQGKDVVGATLTSYDEQGRSPSLLWVLAILRGRSHPNVSSF